jgi:hypothetical protein
MEPRAASKSVSTVEFYLPNSSRVQMQGFKNLNSGDKISVKITGRVIRISYDDGIETDVKKILTVELDSLESC